MRVSKVKTRQKLLFSMLFTEGFKANLLINNSGRPTRSKNICPIIAIMINRNAKIKRSAKKRNHLQGISN
jgi:hypothetical protein